MALCLIVIVIVDDNYFVKIYFFETGLYRNTPPVSGRVICEELEEDWPLAEGWLGLA